MDGYKHFIRIDSNSIVIDRYSEWEGKYQDGDILTEENEERHYNFPFTNERGQYKYKVVNGQMVERTQEELDAEWATRPPKPPTVEDKINLLTGKTDENEGLILDTMDALAQVYEEKEAQLLQKKNEILDSMEAIAEVYEQLIVMQGGTV